MPELDEHQQRVVDHEGGPLLVLAGPGTGKTTTLVEAIVDRIEHRGATPDSVLALTFSRKAAEQLRDRVTARVGAHDVGRPRARRSTPSPTHWSASTPRPSSTRAPSGCSRLPRPTWCCASCSATTPSRWCGPSSCAGRPAPAASCARCRRCSPGRARRGSTPPACARSAIEHDLPELVAAGLFLEQYLTVLDNLGATDYADLIRRAVIEAEAHRDELRARYDARLRRRIPGHRPRPGRAAARHSPATVATSRWWATRTSRSTASAAPTCAASSTSRRSFPTADAARRRPGRRAPAHPPVRAAPAARPPAASPAG